MKTRKKQKEIRKNDSRGITLIALVITMIVLLILAGVSIATLTGENGLLTRANEAKTETEIADEKEKVELSATGALAKDNGSIITEKYLEDELNSYIGQRDVDYKLEKEGNNFIVTYTKSNRNYIIHPNGEVVEEKQREGIKVGDYINYSPDENIEGYSSDKLNQDVTGSGNNVNTIIQDKLDWQVLRIYKDGSIDLIGSPTSQTIHFYGANGYNNGVYIMNNICEELYSRPSAGIIARSINYEDLENWLTDAGKNIRDNNSSFGTVKQYNQNNNNYYPVLYAKENGSGINTSTIKNDGIGISEP